jgi:hypothetical protein
MDTLRRGFLSGVLGSFVGVPISVEATPEELQTNLAHGGVVTPERFTAVFKDGALRSMELIGTPASGYTPLPTIIFTGG